ncbi:hypothetical protein BDV93DRAFT_506737 [Ceratobasidium sp. AG-I]|nr:hypothetical protein BDV93DRAFT_506737 [Ceratobasidium sp. AG-I]
MNATLYPAAIHISLGKWHQPRYDQASPSISPMLSNALRRPVIVMRPTVHQPRNSRTIRFARSISHCPQDTLRWLGRESREKDGLESLMFEAGAKGKSTHQISCRTFHSLSQWSPSHVFMASS